MRKSLAIVITLVVLALGASSLFAETAAPATAPKGVVNINTADASQFALLPRVGTKAAERIIDYRKANGAFKKSTDLMQVKGIGKKSFDVLSPYLTVDGKTTLSAKVRGPKRPRSSKARPQAALAAQ